MTTPEDTRLSPLTEWMVKVVAEAAQRHWMVSGSEAERECCHCGALEMLEIVAHTRGCRFARLEELLRQKPVVNLKEQA